MKNIFKIFLFVILLNIAATAKAGNNVIVTDITNEIETKSNDTVSGIKSNILIFKIISTPAPAPVNNTNGGLKNAGKVARTSYSHSSIESILIKSKGI